MEFTLWAGACIGFFAPDGGGGGAYSTMGQNDGKIDFYKIQYIKGICPKVVQESVNLKKELQKTYLILTLQWGCRSMDGSVLYPTPGHVPGGGGVDPWMVPSPTPPLDTCLGVGV